MDRVVGQDDLEDAARRAGQSTAPRAGGTAGSRPGASSRPGRGHRPRDARVSAMAGGYDADAEVGAGWSLGPAGAPTPQPARIDAAGRATPAAADPIAPDGPVPGHPGRPREWPAAHEVEVEVSHGLAAPRPDVRRRSGSRPRRSPPPGRPLPRRRACGRVSSACSSVSSAAEAMCVARDDQDVGRVPAARCRGRRRPGRRRRPGSTGSRRPGSRRTGSRSASGSARASRRHQSAGFVLMSKPIVPMRPAIA